MMKKTVSLFVLIFSILILGISSGTSYANTKDKPRSFEEIFPELGYKTIEEAVKEFEQHFNQDLKLPLRVPPISFTHCFGRFSDLDGDINDEIELVFISDKTPKNHYKLNVRPAKHKIPFKDKYITKVFKLKNGNEAKYIEFGVFYALVFERDNWQYILSIDKKISDKVTAEMLVEIANSINYPSEKRNPLQ